MRRVQVTITAVAVAIATVHLIWPDLRIDAVTLVLLIVAMVPWLAPLFKSVELPGGRKVEFQDLERVRAEAEEAGLVTEPSEQDRGTGYYSFQLVADEDANLALAGLRIELEKRLRELAAAHGLEVRRGGVGTLLRQLDREDALNPRERGALADMVQLLNNAVHGAEGDERSAQWAIEYGPRLLSALEERIGAA